MCRDTQSSGNGPETAEVASQNVRTSRVRPKRQSSLVGFETEMTKRPEGRKRVSIDGNNVYAPQNTAIKTLDTRKG